MESDGRRICVTGGREFSDRELVREAFSGISLSRGDVLVEGEARGADRLCAEVAKEMGVRVEGHPARWQAYGGVAGPIRNIEMLESGIDLLLAFPGGRGTAHCVNAARERGIPVMSAAMAAGRTAPVPASNEKSPVGNVGSPSVRVPHGDDKASDTMTNEVDDNPQSRLF